MSNGIEPIRTTLISLLFAAGALSVSNASASSTPSIAPSDLLQHELATSCSSTASARKTILKLPDDLANLRKQTAAFEEAQGTLITAKNDDLRKHGKWSDQDEAGFFKNLVSTDAFQSFESQRTRVVNSYMEASEATIESLTVGPVDAACKNAVGLKWTARGLIKITEDQWKFMQAEKDKALKKVSE